MYASAYAGHRGSTQSSFFIVTGLIYIINIPIWDQTSGGGDHSLLWSPVGYQAYLLYNC